VGARVLRRPHVTLTTAGHVDHGKSTLLRALTGADPDRLEEERRRGLSIELGYVWCRLAGTASAPGEVEVAFVDVPGHERFLATMLAGVGPATGTLLVVAADDGWSAQTQEHAEVLHLLGVPVITTVVTKVGRVSAERTAEVVADVAARLRDLDLAGGPTVTTDALTGEGIAELRTTLRDAVGSLAPVPDHGRPRLWIDRRFTVAGAGTVVTGTLTGGRLQVGDRPQLVPAGDTVRIRGLASLGGEVSEAGPGERVAVNLGRMAIDELERGDALVGGSVWRTTTVLDGWARPLPDRVLRDRGAWHVHVGSARTTARLLPFPEREVAAGGAVRVVLQDRLPLVVGDTLVIRDAGRRQIVGAVVVADPFPSPLPRGDAPRRRRAAVIATLVEASRRAELLRGLVDLVDGVRSLEELEAALGGRGTAPAQQEEEATLVRLGEHLVAAELVSAWTDRLDPLGDGTHPRGEVIRALRAAGARREITDDLIDALVAKGTLLGVDGGYVLAAHADTEVARRRRRRSSLVARLDADPLRPPPIGEVARDTGADPRDLAALVQEGRIVRVGDVVFSSGAVEGAVAALRGGPLADRPFTAAEARDLLGTTRRYVIPLLEHLQRMGITTFDGNVHRLRDPDQGLRDPGQAPQPRH
jgi:selenocysteine-specific elongation factor